MEKSIKNREKSMQILRCAQLPKTTTTLMRKKFQEKKNPKKRKIPHIKNQSKNFKRWKALIKKNVNIQTKELYLKFNLSSFEEFSLVHPAWEKNEFLVSSILGIFRLVFQTNLCILGV